MRFVRVLSAAAIGFVVLAALTGCGGKKRTTPVEGQVVWAEGGAPIEGATVTFVSDSNPSASGVTNSDGKFKLTTYTTGDGAVPGDYKVTITKTAKVETGTNKNLKDMDPNERMKIMASANAAENKGGRSESKDELPKEYENKDKSQLKVQVPPATPIVFKLRKTGGGSD
jgi:hypothetical protein